MSVTTTCCHQRRRRCSQHQHHGSCHYDCCPYYGRTLMCTGGLSSCQLPLMPRYRRSIATPALTNITCCRLMVCATVLSNRLCLKPPPLPTSPALRLQGYVCFPSCVSTITPHHCTGHRRWFHFDNLGLRGSWGLYWLHHSSCSSICSLPWELTQCCHHLICFDCFASTPQLALGHTVP